MRLKSEMHDHKELANFGALGYQTEISLYWCTVHHSAYCIHEYGGFNIPTIWQDLSIPSEVITTCLKFFVSITKPG